MDLFYLCEVKVAFLEIAVWGIWKYGIDDLDFASDLNNNLE